MEMPTNSNFLLDNGVVAHNCKAHAESYATLAYLTAWLKHHYSLEWWTAVLRNADKNEITEKFWPHVGHLVDLPDVQHSGDGFTIQNERIRAPLSLLHGVGETAHGQLMAGAPYTDVQDFCNKIEVHREATKYPVKKIKTDDGKSKYIKCEESEMTAWRKGHSALNRKVTYTMIVAGCMDSLFSPELTTLDKMYAFEEEMANATGAKKPKKIDKKYLELGAIERYQMKKMVLPVYGQDLNPLFMETGHVSFLTRKETVLNETATSITRVQQDIPYFLWNNPRTNRNEEIRLVDSQDIDAINHIEFIGKNEAIQIAVVTYVTESRVFNYHEERREACQVDFDLNGKMMSYVKWGGSAKKIPAIFKEEVKGSVVVLVMSKYKADRPFAIDDLIVLQGPLDHKDSEEITKDEQKVA